MSVLTEITLRSLKPPLHGQRTVIDDAVPGFGVRVSQGGTKTFTLVYGPSRQRLTIGRYPIISLSAARQRARELLAEHTLGRTRPPSIAYSEALSLFLAAWEKRVRPVTYKGYVRFLKKHFPFENRRLSDIKTQDITRRLDKLHDTPDEQNHVLAVIKLFFRWALRRRYIEYSPCDALTPIKRLPRERVLTDEELRSVFGAALDGVDNFSQIVALLILFGQRRTETSSLRWEWIDEKNRTITLPASITKNKRSHTFPYGDMAAAIFEKVPRQGEYLFPASRDHVRGKPTAAFNGWTNCKAAFDKKCKIAPWRLHDLRRTFATNMAALRVAPHVVEKMLNHSSGTISGVAAIYNRFQYVDEMRQAVGLWEARLAVVLNSSSDQSDKAQAQAA